MIMIVMIMRILLSSLQWYLKELLRSSKIQVYDILVGTFYSFIKITSNIIFRKLVVLEERWLLEEILLRIELTHGMVL